MNKITILGIKLNLSSRKEVLEQIDKGLREKIEYTHVVSINPENLIVASKHTDFKKVIETAQIHISDGVGIVLASRLISGQAQERVPGVELMEILCKVAYKNSLSVVLIGGKPNLAKEVAECQNQKYSSMNFYGFEGYQDKNNPLEEEERRINAIVTDRKPSIVFVSFGSPFQELWIDRHKSLFSNSICVGVGGAFDFLGGKIPRAPRFMQKIGLEWLFRLVVEPWRWKRQLALIEFIWLVMKQKFTGSSS